MNVSISFMKIPRREIKTMKKITLPIVLALSMLLMNFLMAGPVSALEYQWKFVISEIKDRPSAVKVYELLQSIVGVEEIDINILRQAVFVFFEDDLTDEMKLKQLLIKGGYTVEKMEVMVEPKTGIM